MAVVDVHSMQPPAGTFGDGASRVAPVLRFDQVTVQFEDKPALIDVSFEVHTGETRVVFGATGSGKTVLLKTALGLIRPEAGRVYLFGRNITRLSERQLFPLRRGIGVLFQESALFDSMSVEDNVAYPLLNQLDRKLPEDEVRARVKEALDFVELGEAMEKYPSELSGGMRRRVGIARATVANPSLMLYDSPTGGLDPVTAYRIVKLIIQQREARNATPIVVTNRYPIGHLLANYHHDARTGKLVRTGNEQSQTQFMVLRQGRLVFHGSETELRSSTDPYISIFAKP